MCSSDYFLLLMSLEALGWGLGLGLGLNLDLGVVLPLGPAVSEALVSINCKQTCDIWPAARLDT